MMRLPAQMSDNSSWENVESLDGAVADRINALEAQARKVPIVFPLHVNHFRRRTSSATPVPPATPNYKAPPVNDQPATPLHKAPPLDEEPLHAPSPTRHISPAMYLHSTKDKCVRHGRKPAPQKSAARPTTDMVERGRSGAYVPTGMTVRRQVEATSQWAVTSRTLTKPQGNDACPDCVAELGIRRREAIQTVMRSTDASEHLSTPTRPTPFRMSTDSTTQYPHRLHDISNSSTDNTGDDLVMVQDLGEGLDAAIFERGGELERLIMNSRLARPTVDVMQKLSKELLAVSNRLAFASRTAAPTPVQTMQHRAAIFDALPTTPINIPSIKMPAISLPLIKLPSTADVPAIGSNPSPYHHAPAEPRDLHVAKWAAQSKSPPSTAAAPHIALNPSPYNHAPAEPRDLNVAQWADKKAQEMRKALKKMREDVQKNAEKASKDMQKTAEKTSKDVQQDVGKAKSVFNVTLL